MKNTEEVHTAAENGIETLNINGTDLTSTNLNANEIDKETEQKLRGDAIGDTLYSESFVLKTLLKCNDFEWTESFENDLCFLWDMTVEKDVCEYLFKVSYPTLACECILKYEENRFVEILVGILSNMFCAEDCAKEITKEEIDVVVNLIVSDDPLILIQVMRFLKGLMYTFDSLDFVTERFMQQINFILINSINRELLTITFKILSTLLTYFRIDDCLLEDLIESSLVAYQVLINRDEYKNLELESNESCSIIKCFMQIIAKVCLRVDKSKIMKSRKMFLDVILEIFEYCSNEDNFIVFLEEIQFNSDAFATIFPVFEINYVNELFRNTLKIFSLYLKNGCRFDRVLNIFLYFVTVGDAEEMIQDLKSLKETDVSMCLDEIKAADQKTELNYKYNFMKLYQTFCDTKA